MYIHVGVEVNVAYLDIRSLRIDRLTFHHRDSSRCDTERKMKFYFTEYFWPVFMLHSLDPSQNNTAADGWHHKKHSQIHCYSSLVHVLSDDRNCKLFVGSKNDWHPMSCNVSLLTILSWDLGLICARHFRSDIFLNIFQMSPTH